MQKKCKKCGNTFKVPSTREGNARKYCTQCQVIVYKEHRNKARMKYNKLHPIQKGRIRTCNWCAKQFLSFQGQLYCSVECRNFAVMEQNIRRQRRYKKLHGKSEKQEYFDNLGNSNLTAHCDSKPSTELRKIRKEKRRLGI